MPSEKLRLQTQLPGLVSNVEAVLSHVDVISRTVTSSFSDVFLILFRLSAACSGATTTSPDGAAGRHGTLDCESLSRGRRRMRYVSGLVCCLFYLLGDDSNDNTRQSGKFIFDERPACLLCGLHICVCPSTEWPT